ncbi:hypothetical protein PENSPDRAFT_645822, partial [Peniophora sp. CONT]
MSWIMLSRNFRRHRASGLVSYVSILSSSLCGSPLVSGSATRLFPQPAILHLVVSGCSIRAFGPTRYRDIVSASSCHPIWPTLLVLVSHPTDARLGRHKQSSGSRCMNIPHLLFPPQEQCASPHRGTVTGIV